MAADDFTVPAAAVLCVAIVFGGLFAAITIDDQNTDQVAKACIAKGMVWHDQTNDCTKG